jgi:carbon-monoxide dehydrogenase medium subunit
VSRCRVTFPGSPADAVAVLVRVAEHGGRALVIGGGTLAVPWLSQGQVAPTDVVDLGRLATDRIEESADTVRIGATVSYQQLIESPVVADRLPLLHRMASGITGGIQIRNLATLGGAACAARPYSDAPGVLAALQVNMAVEGPTGTRSVPAQEFFLGPERSALSATEVLVGMAVPGTVLDRPSGYYKLKLGESSWPVVTAACLLPRGTRQPGCDLVLGGVGDVPLVVPLPWVDAADLDRAGVSRAVAERVEALPAERLWGDVRADRDYRRRVAGEVAYRAVRRAVESRKGAR